MSYIEECKKVFENIKFQEKKDGFISCTTKIQDKLKNTGKSILYIFKEVIEWIMLFLFVSTCLLFSNIIANIIYPRNNNEILRLKQEIELIVNKQNEIEWRYQTLLDTLSTQPETSKRLNANSDLYKYRETPWQILSAIHKIETESNTEQKKVSPTNDHGNMQFQPATWRHYCKDLTVGKIIDDIACADRYIQANYKQAKTWGYTDSQAYEKAILNYNHSNEYLQKVKFISGVLGYKW